MGANAQTSVPLYSAGEILTAANMNISAGTGVPVFADTTARDAAFGGTGEKTLAEGQLCYVENLTGVAQIQYYDGSSWVSLSSGGCDLITASTAFTTAATVNVNNVFTTAYRYVQVNIQTTAVSTTLTINLRLRASGTDNSSAIYYMGANGPNYAGATTLYGTASNGATNFVLGGNYAASNRTIRLNFYRAAEATRTNVDGYFYENTASNAFFLAGLHDTDAAFDGFSLITSTGTITGTYSILGFKQ